jgi:hypothetical protein
MLEKWYLYFSNTLTPLIVKLQKLEEVTYAHPTRFAC